jgi:leucyl-tRNA synthetase
MILGGNNEKMSKSRGNVVNPTDVVDEYGADVIRLYEMFMGDFEKSAPWNTESIKGCKRFLDKYWDLLEIVSDENSIRSDFVSDFNRAVKKVSLDIENLKFNTAIASLMDLIGKIKETKKITKKELKVFSLLLNPFAPHVTSEVWEKMGFSENINFVQWPKYDDSLISQKSHEIVIQINGKIRDKFIVNDNINDEELIKRAKMQEKIQNIIKDKKILKEICVTNKLVNLVVK